MPFAIFMSLYANAHRKEGAREIEPEDFMPRKLKHSGSREHDRIVGQFANFQARNYSVTVK